MKRIKSIEISNSPFFENLKMDFSEKLNCIMGGRGTGKSTILYFLKSTIFKNIEEDRTVYGLLKNNLAVGSISLEVETEDGSQYRISKSFGDDPQPYKYPNSEFIAIDKIFDEIECDFYETGRIEEIGRSEKDRLTLIDKKVKSEVSDIQSQIRQVQIDLDSNAQDIKSYNLRLWRIEESLLQYEGIETDFDNQKQQQPAGLKDEEKKEFEEADNNEKSRRAERRTINKLIEFFSELRFELEKHRMDLHYELGKTKGEIDLSSVNSEIMSSVLGEVEATISSIQDGISSVSGIIERQLSILDNNSNTLSETHDMQQAEFVKIKLKFEAHREYINKYHLLSKRLSEKGILQQDLKELNEKRLKLKIQRKGLVDKLNKLKQAVFQIRLKAIHELNKVFDGAILISLTFSGITSPFEDKLREALKGSGLRYNELIPRIVERFSTVEFADVVHNKDVERLKIISGIDISRSESLINALYETEEIYEIERLYCDDLPEFKLRIHEGGVISENYRKSDELSMGQRCTTVLPIIFAVSKNPLIIDQPEDNLDNKYISDKIHDIIKQQKNQRQLILITHNPNIPVLSEAEHNIFLKYDHSASIDAVGDVNEVKDRIIELLEGGEAAFKKRKNTYGY